MKYKIYCGLADFSITVEADSEAEAIAAGKREFIDRFEECDTYYARAIEPTMFQSADQP